jgi:hypothetical protein
VFRWPDDQPSASAIFSSSAKATASALSPAICAAIGPLLQWGGLRAEWSAAAGRRFPVFGPSA